MTIGGFVKQSFIDWGGKTTAVVFTKGCNFRCGYCHNPSLVLPQLINKTPDIAVDNVFDYLKTRKNWIDGVVVTGGEPTIHSDLPDFLQKTKELGYLVKLDTNGTNPTMLERLLQSKLIDYVAMDIKTVPVAKLYSEIIGIKNIQPIMENILKSVRILKESKIDVEFRTTKIPGIHSDEIIAGIKNFLENCKLFSINEYRDGETAELHLKNIYYEQL